MFKGGQKIKEHFGLVKTTIPKCSDLKIKTALKTFVNSPEAYKQQFLQKEYNAAFNGYSFLGQKDSSNQYDTDLLHSFVLSEFTEKQKFPKAFHSFLENDWDTLILKIKAIELEIIKALDIPNLKGFYDNHIGHMMSCNFYPKLDKNKDGFKARLSSHKDVSLFTVFIFGLKEGFSCLNHLGEKQILKDTHQVVFFPGYLLEFLTKGTYKALDHQVDFSIKDETRFSFAFFSIPKPLQHLKFNDLKFTSESYFTNYLSLF